MTSSLPPLTLDAHAKKMFGGIAIDAIDPKYCQTLVSADSGLTVLGVLDCIVS
jgi:hypothetical protein